MKKNVLLMVLLLVSFLSSQAQYVVEVPYVQDTYYQTVGTTFFSIPRPDETYLSVRLRSMSDGFSGLIRDDYSDHFRNPANRISENPFEIYGDIGSVADSGKFMFGGAGAVTNKHFSGFFSLERLIKNNSTRDLTSISSPTSTTSNTIFREASPKKLGGRLSYAVTPLDNYTYGVSYEFSSYKINDNYESINTQNNPSYQSASKVVRDRARKSVVHRLSVGMIRHFENDDLDITVSGIFSQNHLNEFTLQTEESPPSYWRSRPFLYPTDIETKGLVGEAIFRGNSGNKTFSRILAHIGYTKYAVTGRSLLEYQYYSSPSMSHQVRSGLRSEDGSIIDLKIGYGIERKISEQVSGFAALTLNYVKNNGEGAEEGTTMDSSGSAANKTVYANKMSDNREGVDIRAPLSVEYVISEYVLLRGGFEPRYRSGEASVTRAQVSGFSMPLTDLISTRSEMGGLTLQSNLGMSLQEKEYGRIDLLFGNIFSDLRFWSLALRYFP